MKYRNASEIFPDELLQEIQKYTSGELVYIPEKEKRKEWGSASGAVPIISSEMKRFAGNFVMRSEM